MKKLKTYFYSLIDAEDWSVHCGLTNGASAMEVREDIQHNYFSPCYVDIRQVFNIDPIFDDHGNEIGYEPNGKA